MKTRTLPALLLTLSLAVSSCLEDKVEVRYTTYTDQEYEAVSAVLNLPNDRIDYSVELPEHMIALGMAPPEINNAKATLGRVLFYDNKLSRNQSVSCASCHHQELAFADNKAFSEGFDGQLTLRNSLALGSVANFKSSYEGGGGSITGPPTPTQRQFFFWDERAHSIAEQSSLTIQDDIEMGMDLNELAGRLEQVPYYRILFNKAYNTEAVNPFMITDALQEFLNSIVSTRTRFDDGLAAAGGDESRDFSSFTAKENQGKALFIQHCASCHGANMSISRESLANNGLDEAYADPGVGAITGNPADIGKFKVPFLRNIALTAPYMHDGRFATLEDVVEHYNSGVNKHQNLDHRLRAPDGDSPRRLNLSNDEKAALVAFLETLTDEELVRASRFEDPFR
ncbi:MAG: c-type cytochrome [Lewinellaceae bacterium]|nr:c-type cytochrome [Lewinellaceae bacterium]